MVEVSSSLVRVKGIVTEIREKNVTFMAAGIAYNAFLSLAPILVVLLVAISAVGGGLTARIVEITENSLPGPIADVFVAVFRGGAADPTASIVGIVVLIWGSLKIFRGLDTAFSAIYETSGSNSFADKLVDAVFVLVAVVVAIVATVGVTAVFAAFEDVIPYVGVMTPIVLVVGLVVAFIPLYYRFPDADLEWKHALPGAAFAAVGWAGFQAVFQVYLSVMAGGSDSLFGGVVVVITWLYFSGLVLLVGAVINAELGGHTSGQTGGVSREANGYETRRNEEMSRDEFAAYLTHIQAALAGPPTESSTMSEADEPAQYPNPADRLSVIEQTKPDDEGGMRSIVIRWRASA